MFFAICVCPMSPGLISVPKVVSASSPLPRVTSSGLVGSSRGLYPLPAASSNALRAFFTRASIAPLFCPVRLARYSISLVFSASVRSSHSPFLFFLCPIISLSKTIPTCFRVRPVTAFVAGEMSSSIASSKRAPTLGSDNS